MASVLKRMGQHNAHTTSAHNHKVGQGDTSYIRETKCAPHPGHTLVYASNPTARTHPSTRHTNPPQEHAAKCGVYQPSKHQHSDYR